MIYRGVVGRGPGLCPLEKGIREGNNPILTWDLHTTAHTVKELIILGLMIKAGGNLLLKRNIGGRPIVHKYHEGNMQITLKMELKIT